jgi:hypothetical protein
MDKPTARQGAGLPIKAHGVGSVIIEASQPRLPGVIVRTGKRKPVTEKYRRITLMISPQSSDQLRRIAAERFLGNMSAATSWAIGLAAATLDGPLKGLQVPANPADALPTATGMKP